jgi:predicted nucleic acid-binding protein
MSRAIADATVLIYVARLGELRLLDELFDAVVVPTPVYEETVERGQDEGYPDAMRIEDATDSFLETHSIDGDVADRAMRVRKTANLGAGETAAIALAAEQDARCLTDDHAARRTAQSLDIAVGGTIYVLLRALERDMLSFQEFEHRLTALDDAGFHMGAGLYQRALEAGNELAN